MTSRTRAHATTASTMMAPTGMTSARFRLEAGDGFSLGNRQFAKPLADACDLAGAEAHAVDSVGVVGIDAACNGGERRHGTGHADERAAFGGGARPRS